MIKGASGLRQIKHCFTDIKSVQGTKKKGEKRVSRTLLMFIRIFQRSAGWGNELSYIFFVFLENHITSWEFTLKSIHWFIDTSIHLSDKSTQFVKMQKIFRFSIMLLVSLKTLNLSWLSFRFYRLDKSFSAIVCQIRVLSRT